MATINHQIGDTICAIATPAGSGGIAVIRVSGSNAIAMCDKIFRPAHRSKSLATQPANTTLFGYIYDCEEVVDEVVATLFRTPHSFTGEDTVEIACHGSHYIRQRIVTLLLSVGCRMADPGEFTRRAFASGRIDLSQAEAVADLIAATSASAHRLAINQMRGQFSRRLSELRLQLLDFVSLIELELDFSEEDVQFADRAKLLTLIQEISSEISRLASSFSVGNAIKNGIPVAIVGETNAGKSTLLNRLVHDDRALVSDIHGTTRDVIEDTITLGGILFRFIDTAGIRETNDTIESMGIERTFGKLQQSEIAIWLIDSTTPTLQVEELAQRILPLCQDKQLIIVFNKADLIDSTKKTILEKLQTSLLEQRPHTPTLCISAKNDQGIEQLEQQLIEAAGLPAADNNDIIVTNARHHQALTHALDAITRVADGLSNNIPADFVAQDIRECMHHLGEITGQITTDDILGSIFSRFCIGK
ncbi:MAG: tRNA uridine-5-carboxymethylaminomethyl(34) synthesis GTPase MnmE [Bacteroidaceae bacterium]|nr:tRNA uridine-5-carboxymethylaminomethyl(34) synthesis GTPase MnmE [Bacteroidaceae bacterium]